MSCWWRPHNNCPQLLQVWYLPFTRLDKIFKSSSTRITWKTTTFFQVLDLINVSSEGFRAVGFMLRSHLLHRLEWHSKKNQLSLEESFCQSKVITKKHYIPEMTARRQPSTPQMLEPWPGSKTNVNPNTLQGIEIHIFWFPTFYSVLWTSTIIM